MRFPAIAAITALLAANVHADNSTLDAAIGGGIGGATGAAIGNEVGGREGAIIGGAVGGATGAAAATDKAGEAATPQTHSAPHPRARPAQPYYHCPPGQAKKGRC